MAFRLYRHYLTTRPYLTSAITSAIVLATGDALAQSIEHRRYLTLHPTATPSTNPALAFQKNRTFILSLWGGAIFSPFFTRFFHFLDAQPYLKAKTPRNIGIRVVAIFVAAQPLNCFFFVYTSTLEYLLPVDRLGEKHLEAVVIGPSEKLIPKAAEIELPLLSSVPASSTPSPLSTSHIPHSLGVNYVSRVPSSPSLPSSSSFLSLDDSSSSPSSPFLTAYDTISQRVSAQLREKAPTVIKNAVLVWGPFNVVNQWIVPLQWRVVAGSVVSVFWNCWMSMTAHEEVKGIESNADSSAH